MPRSARKRTSSGMYHIMVQGPDGQQIFQEKETKIQYLSTIQKYHSKGYVELLAWCILDNSAHLILQEKEDNISEFMRRSSISFVHWFNKRYHRKGSLFRDRYASEIIVDRDELVRIVRYLHQLPVRYGQVSMMDDYVWSSFHQYANQERPVSDPVYLQLNGYDFKQYMNDFWMDQYLAEKRTPYGKK